jgi:transcriptional regulator with XRE-family HTH domain
MKHTKTLLRALRRERDWSLDVVATKSGIDPTLLSRIERGLRQPSSAQLGKLAQIFGVKGNQLLRAA